MKTQWHVVVPAYYPDGTRKDVPRDVIIEDKPNQRSNRKAK